MLLMTAGLFEETAPGCGRFTGVEEACPPGTINGATVGFTGVKAGLVKGCGLAGIAVFFQDESELRRSGAESALTGGQDRTKRIKNKTTAINALSTAFISPSSLAEIIQ